MPPSVNNHGGCQDCSLPACTVNGLIQCLHRISSSIPASVGVLEECTGAAASPALLGSIYTVCSVVLVHVGRLTMLIIRFNLPFLLLSSFLCGCTHTGVGWRSWLQLV